jgi:serine/threonine-protein kinase HSL1 (negative regulator of Swe1 kinase)
MKYFRQLMSAVSYCHQFNICHRDLKPENILLTKDGMIKIADFGMAALQQTPEHRLVTSCGSPHYAAPEVIKAVPYRGDKVDVWSMGIILYATLSGRLPFDHPSVPRLLQAIQKGNYRMANAIGPEAADLIKRMLQVDPRERISINEIWRHPLIKKYEYLDTYRGGINPRSPDVQYCERPVNRVSDIDKEIMRHLKSLWHQFEDKQLVTLLLDDNPNDQKLFYGLFLKHRDNQLENYTPEIGYSNSDYHHVRPLSKIKKLSTRQFTQIGLNGYKRQISRFTVVSNTGERVERGHARKSSGYAETESAETVKSYDPFKDSRHQNLTMNGTTHAKVVIHRNPISRLQEDTQISRAGGSRSSNRYAMKPGLARPRVYASRSSLASSTKSGGNPVLAGQRYKRGVSFTNMRHPAMRTVSETQANDRNRQRSKLMDEVPEDSPNVTAQLRSRKEAGTFAQPLPQAYRRAQEDVRQVSSSLAKDCDEAFNRSHGLSMLSSSADYGSDSHYSTPFTSFERGNTDTDPSLFQLKQWEAANPMGRQSVYESRPLPVPPKRSESVEEELAEARRAAHSRKVAGDGMHSPRYINRMVSHIDRLMLPNQTYLSEGERRTTSAPNPTNRAVEGPRPLPNPQNYSRARTSERSDGYGQYLHRERTNRVPSHRMGSAPEPYNGRYNDRELVVTNPDHRPVTARAVPLSSSPVKMPAPLNIRKVKRPAPPPGPPPTPPPTQPLPPLPVDTPLMTGALNATKDAFTKFEQFAPNLSAETKGRKSKNDVDPFRYDGVKHTGFGAIKKKKTAWYKRDSKQEDNQFAPGEVEINPNCLPDPKKKGFKLGNLLKKFGPKEDEGLPLGGKLTNLSPFTTSTDIKAAFKLYDDNKSTESVGDDLGRYQPKLVNYRDDPSRQLEPQQNWLARLFLVKPAMSYLCFNLTKRRARQEVAQLLKDWRQFGIKDVVVNKPANLVFGKVATINCKPPPLPHLVRLKLTVNLDLELKEVAFACEFLTVIEHGKRNRLSIARLSQEAGAASSFHRVVATMESVFQTRGLLVGEERKRRMMIKTLTSA